MTKCGYVLQRMIGINRKPLFGYKIFKEMEWVSLTSEFVDYILKYLKISDGEKFFRWIKWCFIPEEFFFQTIAMNLNFEETVVNNNYRFALCKERHDYQPGILDDDYIELKNSNAFFARKMNMKYSRELLNKTEENRNNNDY